MKFVPLFLGVLLLQMSAMQCSEEEEEEEEEEKVFRICAEELKIPEEMMEEGWMLNLDGPEFHCFLACSAKKMGILGPGNKINEGKEEGIMEKLFGYQAGSITGALKQCIEEVEDSVDECDFMNALYNCSSGKIEASRTHDQQIYYEMEKSYEECRKELNLTEEEKKKVKEDPEFAKMKMRCFQKCYLKKIGMLGENKIANLERISEILHALYDPEAVEEAIKVYSKCLEKVKDVKDECDFAEAFSQCLKEE